MERLRAERQIDGWRHFIGDEEIHCGNLIEIWQGEEWIGGRYEAQLHPNLAAPEATLTVDEHRVLWLAEGMPARFLRR